MKITYKPKAENSLVYEKGVFISYNWIIGFLIFVTIMIFIIFNDVKLTTWWLWTLMFMNFFLLVYLVKINSTKKFEIRKHEYGYFPYRHIISKMKRDNLILDFLDINDHPSKIVTEYEFDLMMYNSKQLREFYEECLTTVNYQYKKNPKRFDSRKVGNLKYRLNNKIKILEDIQKYQN